MRHLFNHHHQHGADLVTVAMVMLFLLGFMGISLDFRRLFIVKTELQAAMNSCALAAAQELDGQDTALTRATSAGQAAGKLNNFSLKFSTWSSKGKNTIADITFKDAFYVATTVPANAKYAQCQHTQSGIGMWLLQSMEALSGNTVGYSNNPNIMALAVATQINARPPCPTCTTSGLTGGIIGPPISILVH